MTRRLRADVARAQPPAAPSIAAQLVAATVRDGASGSAAASSAIAVAVDGGLPDIDLPALNSALAAKFALIDERFDTLDPP